MRKVDPSRHGAKREEILDAAVRCFVRRGFHAASIADICAEAGISAGHLYHYFRSKGAIVEAIVQANLRRAADRLCRVADDGASVLEVLAAQAADCVHADGHRAALLFDMFAEAGRNTEAASMLRAHSREMKSLMAALLRRGQVTGEIDPTLDPEAVAAVLISLFDGAKTIALRNPDEPTEQTSGTLGLLIVRLLTTPL